MKKIMHVIFVFILAFGMASCSCNKPEKIELISDQYVEGVGSLEEHKSYETIKSHIDNNDNFVLYMFQNGCLSCKAFKPILEAYVQEKGLKIYSIEINYLDEGNRELRKTLGATPAIGIFKSGELYEHVHYAQEDKGEVMLSKDSFASWFETYVIIK